MPYATNASDGVRVWYEVEGRGPPVTLLHGTTGSLSAFRDLGWAEALRDRYRLILVDLRGHGRSDKPHDIVAYHWDVMAADVVAVLDHIGIDAAHVVGYSTGGLLAFRVAVNHRDRALSIVAGGAQPFAPPPEALADIAAFVELLQQGADAFVAAIESTIGPLGETMPSFRADLLSGDMDAFRACADAEAADTGITDQQVRSISIPALIYAGSEDHESAGERARQAASVMPDARHVELTGLDHIQTMLRSDLVIPLVASFLDDVVGPNQRLKP